MNLRLIGINEEDFYNGPSVATGTMAVGVPSEGTLERRVVARLANHNCEPNFYASLNVPVEMIGDAKVGDEFTVYLERVKK